MLPSLSPMLLRSLMSYWLVCLLTYREIYVMILKMLFGLGHDTLYCMCWSVIETKIAKNCRIFVLFLLTYGCWRSFLWSLIKIVHWSSLLLSWVYTIYCLLWRVRVNFLYSWWQSILGSKQFDVIDNERNLFSYWLMLIHAFCSSLQGLYYLLC